MSWVVGSGNFGADDLRDHVLLGAFFRNWTNHSNFLTSTFKYITLSVAVGVGSE